ncbi:hypothetical protein NQ317_012985 [Molorchus minor]|uniref:Uncharacterized protein n=1 Tax=Molorchus minor TaxID=1323400 RepID=A0ABQ9JD65_9CUCU|nr:hypothetical protein NQ317_012985 [Molorchus minor]
MTAVIHEGDVCDTSRERALNYGAPRPRRAIRGGGRMGLPFPSNPDDVVIEAKKIFEPSQAFGEDERKHVMLDAVQDIDEGEFKIFKLHDRVLVSLYDLLVDFLGSRSKNNSSGGLDAGSRHLSNLKSRLPGSSLQLKIPVVASLLIDRIV